VSAARRVLFCRTEKQLPPLRRLPADTAPRARRLCLADATNSSEGAAAVAAAGAQCCAELSLTPCFVCSNGASSVPSSTGGSVEKRPQSPSSADPSSSSKRLRASVSTPSGVMGAIGDSAKRNSARAHAKNMLDTMVTTTSHPSNPRAVFDKLTGAELCNRSVFERFAGWLTDEESGYKFRDGFEKDGRTPKLKKKKKPSHGKLVRKLLAGPDALRESEIHHLRNSRAEAFLAVYSQGVSPPAFLCIT